MWSAIGLLAFTATLNRPVELADTALYPPHPFVHFQYNFWRAEVSRREQAGYLTQRDKDRAVMEAEAIFRLWDTIWDFTVYQISTSWEKSDTLHLRTLEALSKYRAVVGEEAYYRGWLPPCGFSEADHDNSPNWPFTRIRYVAK